MNKDRLKVEDVDEFFFDLLLDIKLTLVKEELWLNEEFQVQAKSNDFECIYEGMVKYLKQIYNNNE